MGRAVGIAAASGQARRLDFAIGAEHCARAMKPIEQVWPKERRDALRDEWLHEGGWYSPWLHLAVPSLFGLCAMAAAVWLIDDLTAWQLAFGVGLFLLANATEWRVHKSLLHQRRRGATLLYDRHTPHHHMVFITDDMSIRSAREFKMVLLPSFAIILLAVGLSPLIAGLWFFAGQHNLACVFTFVTMGYVVSYEWLHLSYHLPPSSFIGRLGVIRFMRRHHAVHHDPRLMQRWNFNVSLPLWDVVRRTYLRPPEGAPLESLAQGR